MATYRFRITFEDYDDVTRDIEIRSTQTFDDLHHAIQQSIGFDAYKTASFYMSDDNWKKGKEISSRELNPAEEEKVKRMDNARLCDTIADPHQKIYYVFDFSSPWTFRIELVKINRDEDPSASYPRCVRSAGEAPKQYGSAVIPVIPPEEEFDMMSEEELAEEEEESEVDVLAVDEEDLPEGEEKDDSFTAIAEGTEESSDDFEPAEEDMIDETNPDSDEF